MLRDKSLIPLSRQHQHALALCVRIDRAQPIAAADLKPWQAEITRQFEQEIKIHFAAEEEALFPVARGFAELTAVVDELVAEHDWLRREFSSAETGSMSAGDLPQFVRRLAEHIRKEERQLFERLQQLMKQEEMADVGISLARALQDASQACTVPSPAAKVPEEID